MKRNLRLAIEQLATTNDGWDESPSQWQLVFYRYFSLTPVSGTEYTAGPKREAGVTHTAESEYVNGATSAMRLTDGARVWHVKSVRNEGERNRRTLWELEEVVGGNS